MVELAIIGAKVWLCMFIVACVVTPVVAGYIFYKVFRQFRGL